MKVMDLGNLLQLFQAPMHLKGEGGGEGHGLR